MTIKQTLKLQSSLFNSLLFMIDLFVELELIKYSDFGVLSDMKKQVEFHNKHKISLYDEVEFHSKYKSILHDE